MIMNKNLELSVYLNRKLGAAKAEYDKCERKCNEIWDKDDFDDNYGKYDDELNTNLDLKIGYKNQINILDDIISYIDNKLNNDQLK